MQDLYHQQYDKLCSRSIQRLESPQLLESGLEGISSYISKRYYLDPKSMQNDSRFMGFGPLFYLLFGV